MRASFGKLSFITHNHLRLSLHSSSLVRLFYRNLSIIYLIYPAKTARVSACLAHPDGRESRRGALPTLAAPAMADLPVRKPYSLAGLSRSPFCIAFHDQA